MQHGDSESEHAVGSSCSTAELELHPRSLSRNVWTVMTDRIYARIQRICKLLEDVPNGSSVPMSKYHRERCSKSTWLDIQRAIAILRVLQFEAVTPAGVMGSQKYSLSHLA